MTVNSSFSFFETTYRLVHELCYSFWENIYFYWRKIVPMTFKCCFELSVNHELHDSSQHELMNGKYFNEMKSRNEQLFFYRCWSEISDCVLESLQKFFYRRPTKASIVCQSFFSCTFLNEVEVDTLMFEHPADTVPLACKFPAKIAESTNYFFFRLFSLFHLQAGLNP